MLEEGAGKGVDQGRKAVFPYRPSLTTCDAVALWLILLLFMAIVCTAARLVWLVELPLVAIVRRRDVPADGRRMMLGR